MNPFSPLTLMVKNPFLHTKMRAHYYVAIKNSKKYI